jgi:hypothetical protein
MSLIAELKRRNVFRVGVAYAIVGWLLIEVASVLLPTFDAPDWVMKAFSSLVILGFPLTLVIAWAFELTPEGIKRESAVSPDESTTRTKGPKLDFAIIGLLAIRRRVQPIARCEVREPVAALSSAQCQSTLRLRQQVRSREMRAAHQAS